MLQKNCGPHCIDFYPWYPCNPWFNFRCGAFFMPPASLPPCLTGHAHAAPITLAEARRRFEQEATRGTCDTGRYRASFFSWGSGPPILFVPGLSERADIFLML